MFLECFCNNLKGKSKQIQSVHSKFITQRLKPEEIQILELIYDDLATRHFQKKLTYENFLQFFDFTGLWGAKLFREFDQNRTQLLTFQQFLYGISRTAKASYDDKIKLLYTFFQNKKETGIRFKQFIKMLYNYSKEELKQILIDDGLFLQSMTDISDLKKTIPSNIEKLPDKNLNKKVFHLNHKVNDQQEKASSYERAYRQLIDYKDLGTCLEIKANNLTYQVKYSNMNTLVKQFAAKIYEDNKISKQTGRLNYQMFTKWIKSHQKLFQNYYSTFHQQAWSFQQNLPQYIIESKVDRQFQGKMVIQSKKQQIFAMLVGDALIIAKNKKSNKKPIKVICLSGLNVKQVSSNQQFGMQISHREEYYKKSIFYFNTQKQQKIWLNHLKIFQGDSLNKNYWIEQVIGTGKFSVVYRCIDKQSNKVYALKAIQTDKLTQNAQKIISNESEIMRIINHSHIIKYKDTILTKNYIYIITQYISGEDLFQYVKKRKYLSQYQSAFIIGQIIQAVHYLHGLDIIHRDLKPQNIMVAFKQDQTDITPLLPKMRKIEKVKLIDFGLAGHLSQITKQQNKIAHVGGTPNYIAPQLLIGSNLTFKVDTFAIGSILYFLLSGTMPFLGKSQQQTLLNTVRGDYLLEGKHWDLISDEAKDLIVQLLQSDPQQRIDLEVAMNHEWFNAMSRTSRATSGLESYESQKENEFVSLNDIKLQHKQTKDEYHFQDQIKQDTFNVTPFKFPSRRGIKSSRQSQQQKKINNDYEQTQQENKSNFQGINIILNQKRNGDNKEAQLNYYKSSKSCNKHKKTFQEIEQKTILKKDLEQRYSR